jgi:hypothetical protein
MATINNFGVLGGGILHPQHKNKWRLEFNGLGLADDGESLTVQAITVDRPKLEFEKITLDRYNSRAYVAGKYTWQTVTATFESDLGGSVVRSIREQLAQQQHIISNGPDLFPQSDERLNTAPTAAYYKFAINMLMLDGASHDSPVEEWGLSGCYLEQVDWGDLDYAASEVVKVVCTISYDHAEQAIGGFGGLKKATAGDANVENI